MATRRRYKARGFKDGGAVPPSDITNAQPPETLPTPPPVEVRLPTPPRSELPPSDPADHDAVKRAVEAARLADEYQRHPQRLIDRYVDGMHGLSNHKKSFLKANPLLLNQEIMPIAGRAWQQGLAQGVADDSAEMNHHILQAVRKEIEAQRAMPSRQGLQATPAMAPPPMPMPMPGDEAERLEADADTYLAAMKGAMPAPNLPPIATPRRSLPVSAPVSRDIPTASGQKTSQATTVTLSPDERGIAHASYHWMTKARAEEEYAKQKLRLSALRASGQYPERERN